MKQPYCFEQNEIVNITNHFGRGFYEKMLRDLEVYANKWTLTQVQFIPSYSANLVFTCHSSKYGDAVLKFGRISLGEIWNEYNTLREYNGNRLCKVFDAHIENGVLLEERVQPGQPLRGESSVDARLAVFCSLHNGLHIKPAKAEIYPSYSEWVGRITEYMSKREDCKELYMYMKRANDICLSVAASYSQKMLLHGDLHHDNILLGSGGEYKIIDPKGVLGDPVFDVPRFILNEFEDEITAEMYEKINDIIGMLEGKLRIPGDILRRCLFVETAMGACWSVESGAAPEEYANLLSNVAFAEMIMNE